MSLKQKVADKKAVVGVVGLGYVGLPLARAFHNNGFKVMGFDIDERKIVALKEGRNYLKHLGPDFVKDMARSGRFEATANMGRLVEADAVILAVPTPLGPHLEPDMSYVMNTTQDVAKSLRPGQLVVLESTTYPRTTRDDMLPVLEKTGLKHGKDFFLAFSPEREDPGRKDFDTQTIPKLVGGVDREAGQIAYDLYRQAIKSVVLVSSAEVAESAKLLENIFRAINIAMINEMKVVLTAMGIDIWEVIEAAKTKPFGFMPFYPGPGLGGHCIPIDPFYLTWKAREVGHATKFIELAGEINRGMPEYVVHRLMLALNQRGKAIGTSRLLVLGVAYKPDIDDLRESPSFELIEKFKDLGADVEYNDPHIPETPKVRRHDLKLHSKDLSPAMLASYDAVIIATNHSDYDYAMIGKNAKLIVDTRNAMKGFTPRDHIVMA